MSLTQDVNYFYYRMALEELRAMNQQNSFSSLSYNSNLYLNVIDQLEGCTLSRLAEALHISRAAATLKVNELEKQGAVVKQQSEADKRVFYVKLTPPIRQVLDTYDVMMARAEKTVAARYTKEQLVLFSEILRTVAEQRWEN